MKICLPIVVMATLGFAAGCATDNDAHDDYWRRFTNVPRDDFHFADFPSVEGPSPQISKESMEKKIENMEKKIERRFR